MIWFLFRGTDPAMNAILMSWYMTNGNKNNFSKKIIWKKKHLQNIILLMMLVNTICEIIFCPCLWKKYFYYLFFINSLLLLIHYLFSEGLIRQCTRCWWAGTWLATTPATTKLCRGPSARATRPPSMDSEAKVETNCWEKNKLCLTVYFCVENTFEWTMEGVKCPPTPAPFQWILNLRLNNFCERKINYV